MRFYGRAREPVPPPVFYLGWVIQEVPEGFYVYDRVDRSGPGPEDIVLPSMEAAINYIDKKTGAGY